MKNNENTTEILEGEVVSDGRGFSETGVKDDGQRFKSGSSFRDGQKNGDTAGDIPPRRQTSGFFRSPLWHGISLLVLGGVLLFCGMRPLMFIGKIIGALLLLQGLASIFISAATGYHRPFGLFFLIAGSFLFFLPGVAAVFVAGLLILVALPMIFIGLKVR